MHSAMQIGLITNEAVTNALQHAFTEQGEGEVHVRFEREGGRCTLRVETEPSVVLTLTFSGGTGRAA